jgi:DNA-binding PadR family transcriptional regulator
MALTFMPPQTIVVSAIMKPPESPTGNAQPLSPAVFQVLLSLADGEKHGYAILKDVEEHSEGEVRLSTGTLYAIIKRLLDEAQIAECRNRPHAEDDDQRRRYYRLTPKGRAIAAAEVERMERLVVRARDRKLVKRTRLV